MPAAIARPAAAADAVQTVEPARLPAAIAAAEAGGFAVRRIDCSDGAAMVADLAAALNWQQNLGFVPQGLNLDALYDALHHEPNADRPRLMLVFTGMAALAGRDPGRAITLPRVIADRAAEVAAQGWRLSALLA